MTIDNPYVIPELLNQDIEGIAAGKASSACFTS